jgi:hypothetical protein
MMRRRSSSNNSSVDTCDRVLALIGRSAYPWDAALGWLRRRVDTSSETLTYDAWDTPYVQAYQAIGAGGGEVGFTLLWKNDPADRWEYSGPHNTSWRIDRFEAGAWTAVDSGYEASAPVAAGDNYTEQPAWLVAVRRPAPGPGTYRITIGYGGIGQLAGPAWSVDTRPVDLPAGARLAFSERLILDRQPNNEGIWSYVPKGRTHVDLEIIDRNPGAAQALVLYPDGPDGDPRTVVVNKPGTHRIPLEAGEAGKPVRFQPDPEPNVLNVPYFYGLPPIWARSPAALLIPHAVAAADGLTIID